MIKNINEIRNTKPKGYPISFKTEKEINMYKQYQRAAIDLDCSIGHLILEAMAYYQKQWKPLIKK